MESTLSGEPVEAKASAYELTQMRERIKSVSALLAHLINEAADKGLACEVVLFQSSSIKALKHGIDCVTVPMVRPAITDAEDRAEAFCMYEHLTARFEHPASADYLGVEVLEKRRSEGR